MTGESRPSLRAVLVAGDDRAVAALGRRVGRAGVTVCGQAHDAAAAVAAVRRERPDLCLVDAGQPLDAFAVTAAIGDAAAGASVVLFGADPDDEALVAAVAAGAHGYLPEDLATSRLVAALGDVAAGLPAFPRRLATLLIADLRCGAPAG